MAKFSTVVARKDIYEKGIRVPDPKTKSGERKDRSKPHPDGDTVKFAKGETYYTWGFRMAGRSINHESKTKPTRQQLTMSEYQSAVYDIDDLVQALDASMFSDPEEFESAVTEIKEQAESLRDETQDKFDNMPEGFQQADTGQLLEERIQALEDFINELDNIDFSMDEDEQEFKKDWLIENEEGFEDKEHEEIDLEDLDEELSERLTEEWTEKLIEWLGERIEEVQAISIEG